jgi:hypothetical protein
MMIEIIPTTQRDILRRDPHAGLFFTSTPYSAFPTGVY